MNYPDVIFFRLSAFRFGCGFFRFFFSMDQPTKGRFLLSNCTQVGPVFLRGDFLAHAHR